MGNMIVVGDIHLQDKEPKKSQSLDFLEWLFNQEFNNKENILLILGDLCEINASFEMFGEYVNFFTNKSKFKKIICLQGNHDAVNQSTILSIFKPLKNVEVITEYTSYEIENIKCLFLPHYNHEGTKKDSMIDCYSNLYKEFEDVSFDYGFAHIEDETEHFSKKFCDTSKLNVKTWMNGHIHVPTIQNGGHYLGSPILNSFTESGKTPYIASINLENKEYELIEVPKFLEYYEVTYPEKLPKIDTKYALFLVRDSIDKETTIEEYSKQAEELGYKFYTRRILSKKSVSDIDSNVENVDNICTFDVFAKEKEISDDIADICKEIIKLKGEIVNA